MSHYCDRDCGARYINSVGALDCLAGGGKFFQLHDLYYIIKIHFLLLTQTYRVDYLIHERIQRNQICFCLDAHTGSLHFGKEKRVTVSCDVADCMATRDTIVCGIRRVSHGALVISCSCYRRSEVLGSNCRDDACALSIWSSWTVSLGPMSGSGEPYRVWLFQMSLFYVMLSRCFQAKLSKAVLLLFIVQKNGHDVFYHRFSSSKSTL